MNLLWVKVWIRRWFSQCNSASFTLLQPVWVCSWLSSCHFVEHLSSPDSSAAQMRLKETQLLVTDSNQNKQKTCSSLHLQPLQSCVVLHCQIHRHVAPLSALETRVGVCLAVRLPRVFSAIWDDESRRGRFQSRAVFSSPSLSLSLNQSVSAPRSFVLSPPPKRHTCVARKSSRRHGNSCQASGEPLLTWPQRRQSAGSRARSCDAGGLTEQRLAAVEGNDDWNTK